MSTRGPLLAASLLFVLPGCGSVGSRTVSQTPSPTAALGGTTDPGARWVGAEPVGGIVSETRPRIRVEQRQAPAVRPAPPQAPPPAPPPMPAATRYVAPPMPAGSSYPFVRPVLTIPAPPAPPTWPSTSTPPPPPSPVAVWRPAPGSTMPPPVIERPGQLPMSPSPVAIQAPQTPQPPPAPEELVEWAPVGTRDPHAAANDSASLEGPPSGILPAPVVRRRR